MSRIDAHIVGAFADDTSPGIRTGVVLDSSGLNANHRRQIASSLETPIVVFVEAASDSGCDVSLRFFSAAGEIHSCAPATIAAHAVICETSTDGLADGEERLLFQQTSSGSQRICVTRLDGRIRVFLELGAIEQQDVDATTVERVAVACGVAADKLMGNQMQALAGAGVPRFVIGVAEAESLLRARPDFVALRRLCRQLASVGCFLYALHDKDLNRRSTGEPEAERNLESTGIGRMFAPNIGLDEVLVSGNSAGCTAARILAANGAAALSLSIAQGHYAGRPSTVRVDARRRDDRIHATVYGSASILESVSVIL